MIFLNYFVRILLNASAVVEWLVDSAEIHIGIHIYQTNSFCQRFPTSAYSDSVYLLFAIPASVQLKSEIKGKSAENTTEHNEGHHQS